MMNNAQLASAPFMRQAESYMKAHDFLKADISKVRKWVRQAIGDRSGIVKDVTITREYIVITNVYGSTCSISRLALGIQENYK